jgi:hypothetical protein
LHDPLSPCACFLLVSGAISWVGLINARLHPALALCFVVPFMPGPDMEKLQQLDDEVPVVPRALVKEA